MKNSKHWKRQKSTMNPLFAEYLKLHPRLLFFTYILQYTPFKNKDSFLHYHNAIITLNKININSLILPDTQFLFRFPMLFYKCFYNWLTKLIFKQGLHFIIGCSLKSLLILNRQTLLSPPLICHWLDCQGECLVRCLNFLNCILMTVFSFFFLPL